MQSPLVSIIIPTYNRAAYLKLTLESIACQTYQNYEVWVIDDGSPNNEAEIICQQFLKVNYIKISNSGGPAKPRNIGIENAKGKYLAFVDDDDLWLPEKLETQVNFLESNDDFGLVHGCCQVIDEKGNLVNEIIGRPGSPDVKHGDVRMRMMGNWTVMMPTSFIRKEVVDKVGYFNLEIPPALEDVEFWTRCSFRTKFYYFDVPLVLYRRHGNNISENKKKYTVLPLYLLKILKEQLVCGIITGKQFDKLLDNLCKRQIRYIKIDFIKTIKNLFILDFLWVFKKNNLKMLLYILLIKKVQK